MAKRKKKTGFFAALRRLVIFLLVVFLVVGGVGAYLYHLWETEPTQWQAEQVRRTDVAPEVRKARAEALIKRFEREVGRKPALAEQVEQAEPVEQVEPTTPASPMRVAEAPPRKRPRFFVPDDVVEDDVRVSRSGEAERRGEQTLWRERTGSQPPAQSASTQKKTAAAPQSPKTRQRASGANVPAAAYQDGERISFEMSLDEANDWLEFGMPEWLRSTGRQMPSGISDVRLGNDNGYPVLMFRYNGDKMNQVVSVAFDVQTYGDGKARLQLRAVRGGQLRMPVETLTSIALSMFPPDMQERYVSRVHGMLEGQEFEPSFSLDDSTRRTFTGYTLQKDRLKLNFVPADAHDPGQGKFLEMRQ